MDSPARLMHTIIHTVWEGCQVTERNGCPERALEPPEAAYQRQANRLAYMRDDRDDFAAWMAGRMDFFGEALRGALHEMDARIEEEQAYLAYLRRKK